MHEGSIAIPVLSLHKAKIRFRGFDVEKESHRFHLNRIILLRVAQIELFSFEVGAFKNQADDF